MSKLPKFSTIILSIILCLTWSACGGSPRSDDAAPVRQEVPPEPALSSEATPMPAEMTSEPEVPVAITSEPELPLEATSEAETPIEARPDESADDNVVTFNISGGIVGFCDTLTVNEVGEYLFQSCRQEEFSGQLEPPDLESLQTWHDNLVSFRLVSEDNPGGPDNLTSELIFEGQGAVEADETQQQIIFDWVNGLLIRVRPQPVEPPPTPAPPEIGPDGLCPDIQRPAVLVADYENPSGLILIDPHSQAQCDILLLQPPFGRIMSAAGNIYYPVFDPEAQTITIWQVSPAGAQTPLTFTAVTMEQFGPFNFALSYDGTKIAWARTMVDFEVEPPLYRNDLWVADIDGTNQVALLEQVENKEARYVEPIRFAQDNSTLFYALQPDGLGGSIFSFSGRYDSLYSLPAVGGQPQLLYACSPEENPICIGDVSPDGRTLAYTQPGEGVVQVMSSDGNLINTFPAPTTDYVGRAVFGPTGTLAFVSATLSQAGNEELPRPNPGYISLIEPPYTGQLQTLLTDNKVAALWEWLDENRLAYGAMDETGNIGTAIVTIDGQSIELSANYALAVLR